MLKNYSVPTPISMEVSSPNAKILSDVIKVMFAEVTVLTLFRALAYLIKLIQTVLGFIQLSYDKHSWLKDAMNSILGISHEYQTEQCSYHSLKKQEATIIIPKARLDFRHIKA